MPPDIMPQNPINTTQVTPAVAPPMPAQTSPQIPRTPDTASPNFDMIGMGTSQGSATSQTPQVPSSQQPQVDTPSTQTAQTSLTDQQRQQLDGIVTRMQTDGQSDNNIQFVVNDFKQKYGNQTTPPGGLLSNVGGFEQGIVKGATDIPRLAASLGADIGTKATGALSGLTTPVLHSILSSVLSPEQMQKLHGLATQAQGGMQQGLQQTDLNKPTDTAQKLGYGAEKIGEFFIPGIGEEGAGGELASKLASNLPAGLDESAVVGKAANFLGNAAQSGLDFGARSALQQGNTQNAVINTAVGASLPAAGFALKGLAGIGGQIVEHLASTLSGVPKAAIEHAIENPEAVQIAMRAAAQDGDGAVQKVAQNAIEAVDTLKQARSAAYQKSLENLEKDIYTTKDGTTYIQRELTPAESAGLKGYVPGTKVGVPTNLTTGGVKKVFTTTLKDFGATGGGQGGLDFTNVALDNSHISKLNELQDRVYNWNESTPTGLNRLRQVIDSYKLGGVELGSSEKKFNSIVGELRTNLDQYVRERVPQIGAMNDQYSSASNVLDEIRNQLKIGSKDPNTALRKLLNVFNPKSTVYKPIVEGLGKKTGNDLMSQIAGLTMSKWTPEGLAKYLDGAGLLGAGALHALPQAAAVLPLTSPRIVGEAAAGIGKLGANKTAQAIAQTVPKLAEGITSQVLQPE